MRPVIGITLDAEPPGGYSRDPWYALRENYCGAVFRAGGIPVALPHEPDLVAHYITILNGVVITGGAFDVDPALYGAAQRHPTVRLKERRTRFEWRLVEAALAADLPLLAICGGAQLLNVVLGGTLLQHLPDCRPEGLEHEQPHPRNRPGHPVELVPGTLLHRIAGTARMAVNSAHHQGIDRVGPPLKVAARAPDGLVEAVEHPGQRFCLGLQWHPEYFVDPADGRILKAFVEAAEVCRR